MTKKETWKFAFIKSLPIFASFICLGTAYGILMEEAGFPWFKSAFVSIAVYTGAFQFVLVELLSTAASMATIVVTCLLMSSRQTFYSLTFLHDFNRMGRKKPYMVLTMTDETYAVNCTITDLPEKDRHNVMEIVAHLTKTYWVVGTIIGGIAGQLIPWDMTGVDFCMTALFVIIFVDQWEQTKKHGPALIGLGCGIVALLIFGQQNFMLPALLAASAFLLLLQRKEEKHDKQ